MTWRLQVASLFIPSFALLCGVAFICWDSPRFLMKHEEASRNNYERRRAAWKQRKQRQDKLRDSRQPQRNTGITSFPRWLFNWLIYGLCDLFKPSALLPYRSPTLESLNLLRGQPILAAKELLFAHCQLLVENHATRKRSDSDRSDASSRFPLTSDSGWFQRVGRLWTKKYIRNEARAAAIVMISQQLCGINLLIFYSSTLFCDAGISQDSASSFVPLMLSLGIGFTNFACALRAYKWIETHGRRWLLVFSIPSLALTMAGAAVGFAKHQRTVVAVFAYLFTAVYSVGLGPVPFTYSSEVFTLEQRMVGMSFAVSMNFLFAGLLTLFVPRFTTTSLGYSGLLGVFSGFNIVALILIWRYVPELVGTAVQKDRRHRKPMSLERLYHIFQLPLEIYREYQWTIYVPYIRRCWVKFFKGEEAPDMPEDEYFIWGRRKLAQLTS